MPYEQEMLTLEEKNITVEKHIKSFLESRKRESGGEEGRGKSKGEQPFSHAIPTALPPKQQKKNLSMSVSA